MNLTLLAAVVLMAAWLLLLALQVPSGWIHLCYAGAWMLFARRVLVGAPRFRS